MSGRSRAVLGIVLTGAGVVALGDAMPPAAVPAVGVALLGLGGAVADAVRGQGALSLLAVVPGSAVLAAGVDFDAAWTAPALFAVAAAGASLVAAHDRRLPFGGVALLVSAGGAYATVPDTEGALALLGVLVPVVAVSLVLTRARLGGAGAAAAVGMLVWAVAWGGAPRHASVVGGLATLTVPALVPVVARPLERARGAWALVPLALHVPAVAVSSRVAGLRTEALDALAVVVPTVAVAAAALWVTGRRAPGTGPPAS